METGLFWLRRCAISLCLSALVACGGEAQPRPGPADCRAACGDEPDAGAPPDAAGAGIGDATAPDARPGDAGAADVGSERPPDAAPSDGAVGPDAGSDAGSADGPTVPGPDAADGAPDGGADDVGVRPTTDAGQTSDALPLDPGDGDAGHLSDAAAPDAASASDAGAPDLSALPCLGVSRPLHMSRGMPFVRATLEGIDDWFVLDTAATASFLDQATWAARLGGRAPVGLSFELLGTVWSASFGWQDYSGVVGSVPQSGLIGTDFLSWWVLGLDYRNTTVRAAAPATACDDATLRAAGLVPLALGRSAAGYYASTPDPSLPLVPTVTLVVAGAAADTQLDTAFDDALAPFSVNVNPAFLDAIVARGGQPTRAPGLDLVLTTCAPPLVERVEAWRLPPTAVTVLAGLDGPVPVPTPLLFVKRTPAGAWHCGGIGTLSIPAAQVGASYLVELGAVVLDPASRRMWVPAR